MPKLTELAKSRRKLILKWRRFLGLCIGCGAEAYGNSKCDRCQEKQTKATIQRRLKQKENNLCQECGKNKANSDGYRCDRCLELMRARKPDRICKGESCTNIAKPNHGLCSDCLDTREASRNSCNVYFSTCLGCNKLFTSKQNEVMYCSYDCRRESYMVKKIRRECTVCGIMYKLKQGESFDNTCSVKCRMVTIRQDKRNAKDKRRIRIINSYVEPVNVIVLFKRDGGRCQICGKKLNLKRHVPHPLAVTRDHIVPLYQGGEHSYKNTQLACFMCNSIKGCRTISGGEQLLLFGDPA